MRLEVARVLAGCLGVWPSASTALIGDRASWRYVQKCSPPGHVMLECYRERDARRRAGDEMWDHRQEWLFGGDGRAQRGGDGPACTAKPGANGFS